MSRIFKIFIHYIKLRYLFNYSTKIIIIKKENKPNRKIRRIKILLAWEILLYIMKTINDNNISYLVNKSLVCVHLLFELKITLLLCKFLVLRTSCCLIYWFRFLDLISVAYFILRTSTSTSKEEKNETIQTKCRITKVHGSTNLVIKSDDKCVLYDQKYS